MKSRISLSSNYRQEFNRQIERGIHIERGYIAQCVMLLFALELMEQEHWGHKRIERFMDTMYAEMDELSVTYEDEWTDIVQKELERRGVQFNKYWIVARDSLGKPLPDKHPKLTKEQEEYIKKSRETFFSDAERKLIHNGWKNR